MEIVILVISMFVVLASIYLYYDLDNKKDLKKQKEKRNNVMGVAGVLSDMFDVPSTAKSLVINKWSDFILKNSINATFWVNKDTLKILSLCNIDFEYTNKDNIDFDKVLFREIKLKNIDYYFNTGNFYTETQISGGGGGGTSLGGAVVGSALFGLAGAVIGSRKKIDPITSKLLTTDTRETVIKYTEDSVDKFIHIPLDEMLNLFSLLPGKSIEEVYQQKDRESDEQGSEVGLLKEKLIRLKELKEEELITEEEYQKSREKLVASL